jgi:Fe-S-cluster-containing dehydrogenase component
MTGAGFTVDLHRCVGCGACVLACRLENGWPAGAAWRRVVALNGRRHPGGPAYFLSVACHHCEDPACLDACPSRAYEKHDDGVVLHHADRCLGCRYCEMTCPFGAPKYDAARGVMGKCHLCHHRLDRGGGNEAEAARQRLPACVAACPTEALRYRAPGAEPVEGQPLVPGFADVARCRPATRFKPPAGQRRAGLFLALERAIRAKGDGR